MSSVAVLGIDLAKYVFQLHGVDGHGRAVVSRRVSRAKLAETVVQLAPKLVAMEASCGAHHWGRRFRELGLEVRLIHAKFVSPFVKSLKNDGERDRPSWAGQRGFRAAYFRPCREPRRASMHLARCLLPAAAVVLLASVSPAHAQQAGSTVLHEAPGEVMVEPFNKSSTELEDMNILSNEGEEMGEVERVLVDGNGQPVAITAEIGGFLGVGEKIVVIGLDRLELRGDEEPDVATTHTKEELQGMQAWGGQ